jgi:branched-subunit amino acid transport protein
MAVVTYLLRLLPLLFVRHKINSRFIRSFLYYVPYSVLTVMTIPDIFYSTSSPVSATVGFATALVLAFFDKGLLKVAAISCAAVLAAELLMIL